jgi:hypothetical protein
MRSRRWIPILGLSLAAAAVLIAIVFIAVGEESQLAPVEGADTVQRLFGGVEQDGDALGEPDAPVTITFFNDLQCTDCADYQLETVPPLVESLVRQGDARLELRHRAIGAKVVTEAALGSVAAGVQDHQWDFAHLVALNLDQVEVTGTSDQFSGEFLERVAEAIPSPEFDVGQWESDREDPELETQIESDDMTAIDLGLAAPSVVVEGPSGSITLEDYPSVEDIEAAAAEAGA